MKAASFISLLLAWPTVAVAANDAQCDAKPFTLTKPKPATQQPAGTAAAEPTKPTSAASKAAREREAKQAKQKPIADCKEPKKG